MNILMTIEGFYPRIGGAEVHTANIITRLEEQGHTVTLVTNEERTDAFDTKHRVIRIAWNRNNVRRIIQLLWRESKNADILHCHYSNKLGTVCGVIGKLRRKPVFIIQHGMGLLDEPGLSGRRAIMHSLYRWLSQKLCTHEIVTSEDLAKLCVKYVSRKKITIVPNGFDERIFNREVRVPDTLRARYAGRKVIVTVRRLTPKTGIQYLVAALPYIVKEVPEVKYVMIGGGKLKERIQALINELGMGEYIDMLGSARNEEVPQYYALADAVVFPSTAESTCISCSEAMAVGAKIVASRVGGLVELIGEHEERGRFVKLVDWEGSDYHAPWELPAERIQQLARIVVAALRDSGDEKSIQASEYAYRNLSWEVVAEKTLEVYRKVRA